MKQALSTVRHPLITEKSTILREKDGTYCFRVDLHANKIEIARAIEWLFEKQKVRVAEVRTARVHGKARRMGRFVGRRPDWKKAWIRLAPGSGEIDLFESN